MVIRRVVDGRRTIPAIQARVKFLENEYNIARKTKNKLAQHVIIELIRENHWFAGNNKIQGEF